MHLIYEAVKKTEGNTDGEALVDAAADLKKDRARLDRYIGLNLAGA